MVAGSIDNNNIIIIPNIINKTFNYQRKQLPVNGGLTFLCVASWKLPKRLDLIFDALCSYSRETNKIVTLKVIGDGPQVENFKKKATPKNLHIEWLGFLEKEEIAGLYKYVHVFLHASNIETFSVVTAEALSTGTPVLVSNTGALPELVSENSGITVENTIDAWLKGIKDIVNKSFDYYAISAQYKDKFSPVSIANSIISVYRKANSY
jgi:glycosyltransferase involved in cell wall biosynthesis